MVAYSCRLVGEKFTGFQTQNPATSTVPVHDLLVGKRHSLSCLSSCRCLAHEATSCQEWKTRDILCIYCSAKMPIVDTHGMCVARRGCDRYMTCIPDAGMHVRYVLFAVESVRTSCRTSTCMYSYLVRALCPSFKFNQAHVASSCLFDMASDTTRSVSAASTFHR